MKCEYCKETARHTLVEFYHDYGCPVSWYPVCDDHTQDYKPYGQDDRGSKTAYGVVLTTAQYNGEGHGSDLGLSLRGCELCHDYYFPVAMNNEAKSLMNDHDLGVCNSCAINPNAKQALKAIEAWYRKELTAYEIRDIFKGYKIKREFYAGIREDTSIIWLRS